MGRIGKRSPLIPSPPIFGSYVVRREARRRRHVNRMKNYHSIEEDFGSMEAAREFYDTHSTTELETEPVDIAVSGRRGLSVWITINRKAARKLIGVAESNNVDVAELAKKLLEESIAELRVERVVANPTKKRAG